MAEIKQDGLTFKYDPDVFTEGDLCKIYPCTIVSPPVKHKAGGTIFERLKEDDDDEGHVTPGIMKVALYTQDNDLLGIETAHLSLLCPTKSNNTWGKYFPQLSSRVTIDHHFGNVLVALAGYTSMADVLKAYPAGVDYRDLAWMAKRVLEGLGDAHRTRDGIVHGALLPQHIMLNLAEHGAKIIDWCYSVELGSKKSIQAYVAPCKAYYPPEVFQKRFPTEATDIYMLAKCCVALLGGNVETNEIPNTVPTEFAGILRKCLQERMSDRPQDSWILHDEITKTLEKLVGKPKFRPFIMPSPV